MNYTLDQYADTVVGVLDELCAEAGQALPALLSESGRALTAHHAVLVTQVLDRESMPGLAAGRSAIAGAAGVVGELGALLHEADALPPEELWLEATTRFELAQQAFLDGHAGLPERALAERLYYELLRGLPARLDPRIRRHRELEAELQLRLADKDFINLSIFQSLPDIWALDQVFPVMPIERLDELPQRRAVLEDLTCDSDGRIDRFVDLGGVERTLRVHDLRPGEPYRLGIFMSGAYQETLGDMHNLFGDTDSVDARLADGGVKLTRARRGDSAADLLVYVGYQPELLQSQLAERIAAAGLDAAAGDRLRGVYAEALRAHTYLDDGTGGDR
jgi:arginine decarboxylase